MKSRSIVERTVKLSKPAQAAVVTDTDPALKQGAAEEKLAGAIKLARSYHHANGEPMRRKVIGRKIAYHGTTYGALSLTGITGIRAPLGVKVYGDSLDDVEAAAQTLRANGVRVLFETAKRGTAGSKVNFCHPKDCGGVLIELVQAGDGH